jgi:putative ABC transport system substrate-binding protein
MDTLLRPLFLLLLTVIVGSPALPVGKVWKVAIVTDTREDFALKTADGFRAGLDALLDPRGESAVYTQYDTELSEAKAASIIQALQALGPDLIVDVNHPTCFADQHIAAALKGPQYRFVAENAVPVQSGSAQTWDHPGGNITGVGVFVRFNSELKLMKLIRPQASKLVVFSWDATTMVNQYYEQEVRRACREEKVELVDFHLVPNAEAQFEYMGQFARKGSEYFIAGAISAWVHADGTPADMAVIERDWVNSNLRIPYITYDEVAVKNACLAGACVIWSDLGAQLAEKGLKVLDGANPGDLPWEYPRKYNIVLNRGVATRLGITFPQALLNAAYRVYTDTAGHFVGQGD